MIIPYASYGIKAGQSRDPALTWALGRHLLRLLGRPEEDWLARWAAAAHADALHVNDVLRVLIQVPQCTGARGGVHLLDEPPHADILLLRGEQKRASGQKCNGSIDWGATSGKYCC